METKIVRCETLSKIHALKKEGYIFVDTRFDETAAKLVAEYHQGHNKKCIIAKSKDSEFYYIMCK